MASPLSLRYFFTRAVHLSLSDSFPAGSHRLKLDTVVDPPVLVEVRRSNLPLGSMLYPAYLDSAHFPTFPARMPTLYATKLYYMIRESPVDSMLLVNRLAGSVDIDIVFHHLRYEISTTPTRGGTFDIIENMFKIGEVVIEPWPAEGGNVIFAIETPFNQSWPVLVKVCNESSVAIGATMLQFMPTPRTTIFPSIVILPDICMWLKTYAYDPYTLRTMWLAYVVVALTAPRREEQMGRIEFYGVVHNATPA